MPAKSMSKDDIKKMSFIYEAERRESFDDDDLISHDEGEQIQSSYSNPEGDFALNFFQKTDDEVRQAYLNRLIGMKILKLQPKRKVQEIVILDWDDTLLCTSYLGRVGLVNLPDKVVEALKVLDEKVRDLLEMATNLGKTFIVTNANPGWVTSTGMVFLPKSYDIIKEKVEVVSAREQFGGEYPDDTYKWKIEAFMELRKKFEEDVEANIVCVGDSRQEMEAARCLGEQFERAVVKTVKFKSSPGVQDIIKQVGLLNEKFAYIISSKTNLTIRLEKK